MALSRFDPLSSALYDPFSLFLGAPIGGGQLSSRRSGGQQQITTAFLRPINLDVKETESQFEILADVPGVEHSRVNLTVEDDVVSIEVTEETERKEEDPKAQYYRSERSSAFQSRSVRLPPSANMEELKADVEHGVLHVRVPKRKQEKGGKGPRRIQVGGGAGVISAAEK